jgi:hypothetical protein
MLQSGDSLSDAGYITPTGINMNPADVSVLTKKRKGGYI